MGLPLYVDFAPLRKPKVVHSLALVEAARPNPLCAHIHIGKFSSELERIHVTSHTVLLDKGTVPCPAEIDIAYSEIHGYLEDEGVGANVVVEPVDVADLALDMFLQRTTDGRSWSSELLLRSCCAGTVRRSEIPDLQGGRARVRVRISSPKRTSKIRIWANEPRQRRTGT